MPDATPFVSAAASAATGVAAATTATTTAASAAGSAAPHVWVHDLNPFVIHFTGNFGVRWYGLAYMTGFILGWAFALFIAKRGRRSLSPELVTDFTTYIVLGVMIGGRLGYALFYAPELLTQFSSSFPFWGVLEVWQGGMASHGGMIGVIVACLLFARKHKLHWFHLGDLTIIGGAIGIFFGRVANFINGELMGRPCDPSLPWAVKFPADIFKWMGDPAKVGASETAKLPLLGPVTSKLGVSAEQWGEWVRAYRERMPGWQSAQNNISSMLDGIVQAIQNGNAEVKAALAPLLEPRHPSQIYEALLEGLLLFVICAWTWRKPQKPGVIGALFLTLYAIVRIVGEQFRLPDAHIGFQLLGLTRGQWLSSGMLVASSAVFIYALRRPAEKISGWGPEAIALREADLAKASKAGGKQRTRKN
jgi:phosphatidylglycerol:prolipoprotein diacylglycerol transferase